MAQHGTPGPPYPWTSTSETRAFTGITTLEADDTHLQFGVDLASLILWTATGRQYGLRQHTARPCHNNNQCYRATINDLTTRTRCNCSLPTVTLPGPVAIVEQVMIDGTTQNPANFVIPTSGVHARKAIARTDGETWPCTNDYTRPATTTQGNHGPAWHIIYWRGTVIPSTGIDAAHILADQLARRSAKITEGCDNNLDAKLVRSTRRGRVRDYTPAATLNEHGVHRTGIDLVDKFIEAVNPNGLRRRPNIIRADDPTRTGPAWTYQQVAAVTTNPTTPTTGSSTEIGRGTHLPANDTDYHYFELQNNPDGMPDGFYRWDETAGAWVQV